FLKPGTTYGTTGGTSTHNHVDINGATSGAPSATANGRTGTSGASDTHTHSVNITNFAYTSNWPPYIAVIFAKRHAGVAAYTQNAYRWYVNQDAEPPTDDWPSGSTDLQENEDIPDTYNLKYADVVRLRMNV